METHLHPRPKLKEHAQLHDLLIHAKQRYNQTRKAQACETCMDHMDSDDKTIDNMNPAMDASGRNACTVTVRKAHL